MKNLKKIILPLIVAGLVMACGQTQAKSGKSDKHVDYKVYLSLEYDQLPEDLSSDILVIDAQYYNADQIASLHENNDKIYTYINVGSIETFRDYYRDYEDIILGSYENWDEEYWVDVTSPRWQSLILDTLVPQYIEKGIDGFFVDNTDVYYNYYELDIYLGLCDILTGLKDTGKTVIINGGDTFVQDYLDANGNLDDVLDGVNQESVFTAIDWDTETFHESEESEREYFLDYLDRVKADGKDVYLVEYASDYELVNLVEDEANALGYSYYISDSLELD